MNDNKLPIVTLKVWCENVRKANKAHVSFRIEEVFLFFFWHSLCGIIHGKCH